MPLFQPTPFLIKEYYITGAKVCRPLKFSRIANPLNISLASLFINPIVSYVLYSAGNIPVDRKSKDRKVLLKGTMEALSKGYAVALFPEGTSYTEPRIMQIKDGAAWAALEYTKWKQESPEKQLKPLVVVPAAIVYTNKTKYRSDVSVDSLRCSSF
jgi:hypothetical protein